MSSQDTVYVNPDRADPEMKSHIWVEEDVDGEPYYRTRCRSLPYEVSREDLTEFPVHFVRNNEAFCQTCRRLHIPDDEVNDRDGFDISGPEAEADGDGWEFAKGLDLGDTNVVESDTHVTRMRYTIDVTMELPTDDRSSGYVMSLDTLGAIGRLDHVTDWSWRFAGQPTVDVRDDVDEEPESEATAD